jgi:alcohol dehydrogenase class IV
MKGGERMKRLVLILLPLALLMSLVSGCATRDYVKQQIEPLVDRISKLEAKCGSSADLSGVKQEAADAKALAEEALKNSKECCANSEEAAKRAEAAAERAEAAAKKAEKAFELHQMK